MAFLLTKPYFHKFRAGRGNNLSVRFLYNVKFSVQKAHTWPKLTQKPETHRKLSPQAGIFYHICPGNVCDLKHLIAVSSSLTPFNISS